MPAAEPGKIAATPLTIEQELAEIKQLLQAINAKLEAREGETRVERKGPAWR